MKRFFIQYTWLLLLLVFVSCTKESEDPVKSRTLIMYLIGDSDGSISNSLRDNINDVVSNWSSAFDGNVIIYADLLYGNPQLIDVQVDSKGKYSQRVIKEYEEMNSTSPEVFAKVVQEMKSLYPANSYGLVWGSHGDGWVSKFGFDYDITEGRMIVRLIDNLGTVNWKNSRAFGIDGTDHMDVVDMVKAIEMAFPEGLDFLLWDACYMSSIEVLYELRGKVRYVIASAMEVPVAGFPYGKILPYLWDDMENLPNALSVVCDKFVEYYAITKHLFGTIALMDLSRIDDFFEVCHSVLGNRLNDVQKLSDKDLYRYPLGDYRKDIFYDLGVYLRLMTRSDEEKYRINTALDAFVVHKGCVSPYTFREGQPATKEIPADKFSGVNVFVPSAAWNYGNYYQTLSWFKVYGE